MTDTQRDLFIRHFPVSHETLAKLDRYQELLIEWNQKFNLVAASTIPQIWTRHFLDSAQLYPLVLKEGGTCLVDIGSGAGFPGLVLAIMGVTGIHLVDSVGKKANFLKEVAKELSLDVTVHNDRIENLKELKADIVTARAVGALPELLKLAQRVLAPEGTCLFLKGQNAELELTESAKYWTFKSKVVPSLSDSSGHLIILRQVQHRKAIAQQTASSRKRAQNV